MKKNKEELEKFGFWIVKNDKDYDLIVSVKDTVQEYIDLNSKSKPNE
jgi:hypothetical protein